MDDSRDKMPIIIKSSSSREEFFFFSTILSFTKIIKNTRIKARLNKIPLGSVFDFVDFKDNTLKIKFICADKTEFLVQGKKVTMEDELKKEIEKYLKAKINNAKIIFE